jgi:hypothetical protein
MRCEESPPQYLRRILVTSEFVIPTLSVLVLQDVENTFLGFL